MSSEHPVFSGVTIDAELVAKLVDMAHGSTPVPMLIKAIQEDLGLPSQNMALSAVYLVTAFDLTMVEASDAMGPLGDRIDTRNWVERAEL